MKNLKICFIASVLGQGGAERQLYYILKALKTLGVDCYLICFTQGDYWEQSINELGVHLIFIEEKNKFFRLLEIIRQIGKYNFDIIQSAHFQINLYLALSSWILNKKSIGAIRSDLTNEINELGILGWLCFILPGFIAANSKAAIHKAIKLGRPKDKIFFLPNVVDETVFIPQNKEVISDKLIGIFLGSLCQPKRVDRIIQLAEKCKNNNLSVEFRLYGEGILRNELLVDAQKKGVLNCNLLFMGGTVESNTVLKSGDFLILTSDLEGTPNVVLEAMASGLAVVSTDVGDVGDLIKNGINGFITPLDDLQGLYEAIRKLTLNPQLLLRMKRSNRENIISSRSYSLLGNYLIDLYSSIGAIEK